MTATAPPAATRCIVLAHGGGGELMHDLIRTRVLPPISNETLAQLTDAAILPAGRGRLAFTTDAYVVSPLEFPGGDIGALAVAGTVNDLAVMGAAPLALSLSLILEEGLPLETLDRIMASIAETARRAGVEVVTGDTKVVERGRGDGLFITTAGVGWVPDTVSLHPSRIRPGDLILINGPIAEHGLAIMACRSGIGFDAALRSDTAPLNDLIATLLHSGADVRFMRDATRGGLAGVLADISEQTGLSVEIVEERIPIAPAARHAAELLGIDPLIVANEGKVVAVVRPRDGDRALEALRSHELGRQAACIGRVTDARPPLVELCTRVGGRRIVPRPYGEELPRIC